MIEERALVVGVDRTIRDHDSRPYVTVRAQRQSACETCQSKAGCGQGALAQLAGGRCLELTVVNELDAEPGDIVVLAIPEQGLLTASLLVYLLPLLLMIVSSVIVQSVLSWSDGAVALTGLLALASGFVLARRVANRTGREQRFSPKMVAIEAHGAAVN